MSSSHQLTPKRFFCTYFDENYCERAIAMFRSLQVYCPDHQIYALCMDEASKDRIDSLRMPLVTTVGLSELERYDPDLLATKAKRSPVEYCWTCGPVFTLYVMRQIPRGEFVTYLDADLYFFSSVEPVYQELDTASVGIIAHRFSARHKSRERFGIYNVGWISFRNDADGTEVLDWWRERCIEWCFDVVEGERFGDQKYLDAWPHRFRGVTVIQHKGVNVAAWNVAAYSLSKSNGVLLVDDQPLIFFHFHGFKRVGKWLYDSNLARSGRRPSKHLRREVFGAYIHALREVAGDGAWTRNSSVSRLRKAKGPRVLRSILNVVLGVARRSYLVEFRGRVL